MSPVENDTNDDRAPPIPDGCFINAWSSRVCERGTKSCVMVHYDQNDDLLRLCQLKMNLAVTLLPVSEARSHLNDALYAVNKYLETKKTDSKKDTP